MTGAPARPARGRSSEGGRRNFARLTPAQILSSFGETPRVRRLADFAALTARPRGSSRGLGAADEQLDAWPAAGPEPRGGFEKCV